MLVTGTKKNRKAVLVLLVMCIASPPLLAADRHSEPAVSGVNDVNFGKGNYQAHLGNGFVVQYQGRFFGVTAKHVLLMGKNTAASGTELPLGTQWFLRNKAAPEMKKPFGAALNVSASEPLDLKVLEKDTLVFALDAVPEGFVALKLADKTVDVGDTLTAIGCSYQAPADCSGEKITGQVVEMTSPHLLVDLGKVKFQDLFGLSGAPVLNEAGELVGLVSQFLPDSKGVERAAHFDVTYLRRVLQQATAVKSS